MQLLEIQGADFSAVIGVRDWTFGFVAYRQHTQLLLGDESEWLALPSWLTGLLFFGLALLEWLVFRFLTRWIAARWVQRSVRP